eukprot:s2712_g4.t1
MSCHQSGCSLGDRVTYSTRAWKCCIADAISSGCSKDGLFRCSFVQVHVGATLKDLPGPACCVLIGLCISDHRATGILVRPSAFRHDFQEPTKDVFVVFNKRRCLQSIVMSERGLATKRYDSHSSPGAVLTMPTLFPDEVPLPNGPLLERPSALLAAYKAGQHHEDTLWLFVVVALVLAIGACIVRTRLTRCGLGSVRDATQFRDERRDVWPLCIPGTELSDSWRFEIVLITGLADEGQARACAVSHFVNLPAAVTREDSPATLPGFTPEDRGTVTRFFYLYESMRSWRCSAGR